MPLLSLISSFKLPLGLIPSKLPLLGFMPLLSLISSSKLSLGLTLSKLLLLVFIPFICCISPSISLLYLGLLISLGLSIFLLAISLFGFIFLFLFISSSILLTFILLSLFLLISFIFFELISLGIALLLSVSLFGFEFLALFISSSILFRSPFLLLSFKLSISLLSTILFEFLFLDLFISSSMLLILSLLTFSLFPGSFDLLSATLGFSFLLLSEFFISCSISLLLTLFLSLLFLSVLSSSLIILLFLSLPNIPLNAPAPILAPNAVAFPKLLTPSDNELRPFIAPLLKPYPAITADQPFFNPASIPNILSMILGPSITAILPPTSTIILATPLALSPAFPKLVPNQELNITYSLVIIAVENITINIENICFIISFNFLPSPISAKAKKVASNLLNANSNINLATFNPIQTRVIPIAPKVTIIDKKSIPYL